jgi:pimeloyl-ACP methyl ester carboxylesterase
MADATVVFVHGLWLSGHEAFLLRRRLESERGYHWWAFPYHSAVHSMDAIADSLAQSIAAIDTPVVHMVGHSLGGLVILRFMQRHHYKVPGRAVFLGTPSLQSVAAHTVARFGFGRALLGPAALEELLHARTRHWEYERELGIIAGNNPMGLARMVVEFTEPNDGVVTLAETRLPGATAHVTLPVSHTGMLLSGRVAQEVGEFLEYGRFHETVT